MRSIILGLGISLDGYIARPDGAFDFLFMPKDLYRTFAAFMAGIDTTLMGRKTWEISRQHAGGSQGNMNTYVFSRTLPAGERDGVIFVNRSVPEVVRDIREHRGKNIWVSGGSDLALEFLRADLVDEIHLGIVPTLIGAGIPLFRSGFPQREFKLIENQTFSKGVVSLKYQRLRKTKARRH